MGQQYGPCQGQITDAMCSVSVVFPAGYPTGTWTVSSISLTNNAGQTQTFTNLNAVPLTVTANSPLSAGHFTTTPAQLNSWKQAAPFRVSMQISGAQNGVSSIQLYWTGMGSGCTQQSTSPTLDPSGSYSVPATLGLSFNGSPTSCVLSGATILDGAGNLALYGSQFSAPDPGVSVKGVADTTPPTVTSAALNVTSIAQSKAPNQSFVVNAKVSDPTAPVDGYSTYLYNSSGTVVGQATGGTNVGADGNAMLFISVPYGIAVGTYTVGFSVSDAGWLTSYYGMPGKQPVPGGPLTLTITAG